ncbi:hypothetical protein J2X85_003944 [Microbacterium trichothecenolyticum]|uniref:hypothetical protein n=1 Tax=Microbacterium trichothecenolyticum TaxID=69370 RepID=UPI002867A8A2|nr:hypothetical protein [Microbacterium trichothecenolyticum]MDR7186883.1 hypothetical protein [Microbacterium trichothecenolyticum]
MTVTDTTPRHGAGARVGARAAGRPPRGAQRIARVLSSRGLGLFSETIVVSLAVAVLALPAVTALPAFAAGAAHFRRHVEGESDSLLELGRDFLRALRRGWLWGVLSAAAFWAIAATLTSPVILEMPGGGVYRWASGLIGLGIGVVLLRAIAQWRPTASWSALIRGAAEESVRDIPGSFLLLLALGMSGLVVWMFAPLVVLVPGMLVLAARAVVSRAG